MFTDLVIDKKSCALLQKGTKTKRRKKKALEARQKMTITQRGDGPRPPIFIGMGVHASEVTTTGSCERGNDDIESISAGCEH